MRTRGLHALGLVDHNHYYQLCELHWMKELAPLNDWLIFSSDQRLREPLTCTERNHSEVHASHDGGLMFPLPAPPAVIRHSDE
jgi:hypothetical protein